mmetsp:Transcript_30129/g.80922  ORF Transcript_30129/g.80922 Transcript_30129/m.80922 type:complete len:556 (-) Transcript_30129:521-2188(-)
MLSTAAMQSFQASGSLFGPGLSHLRPVVALAMRAHHWRTLSSSPASPLTSDLTWSQAKRMPPRSTSSESAPRKKPGPLKGSDVPRLNIGIFGAMNAGKSLLMNRITRQETSIVDGTPGTTADTKIALFELHDVGPVKIFDTAGVDESGDLGAKKRAKTLSSLKESDLAVVVADTEAIAAGDAVLTWERQLLEAAAHSGVLPLLVVNVKRQQVDGATVDSVRAALCRGLGEEAKRGAAARGQALPYDPVDFERVPVLVVDLQEDASSIPRVTDFLQDNAQRVNAFMPRALPDKYLQQDAGVFLNIPMDAETPSMRLLRPQALVQEEAIRHWATTVSYRMDLAAARGNDPVARERERQRFMRSLRAAIASCPPDAPKILVTDSQAMDVVHPWTLDKETGKPLVDVTTFSIAMMHRMSGARLPLFAEGMRKFQELRPGDRILIAEACNHNRITDTCNDIGMVQIPDMIANQCKGVGIDHAFGREFPALDKGLENYDLIIHCGACMIDHQKVRARISDALEARVPITNYGLLMSYAYNGSAALNRVLKPWTTGNEAAPQ